MCVDEQTYINCLNDESILKILRALDINEAHDHDDTSIQMIKLCDKSIIPAISLIYNIYGRNPILSQFIRTVISKFLTITDQFHFY